MSEQSQSEQVFPVVEPTKTEFKSPSLIDMVSADKADLVNGKVDLKALLKKIEISYLEAALASTNNVVSHAAQKLNMRRTTFIEKMKKHQIVRQTAE